MNRNQSRTGLESIQERARSRHVLGGGEELARHFIGERQTERFNNAGEMTRLRADRSLPARAENE